MFIIFSKLGVQTDAGSDHASNSKESDTLLEHWNHAEAAMEEEKQIDVSRNWTIVVFKKLEHNLR
jgi:hypothetical protein